MTSAPRTVFQRVIGSQDRILAWAAGNTGLLILTVAIIAAGVLAFYLVALPPGAVTYP